MKPFFLMMIQSWAALLTSACQYAKIDPRYSLCIYRERACEGKHLIKSGELTCKEKEEIVSMHNTLRHSVASGSVSGQPAAVNMLEMFWDDELAAVAQRWADQCLRAHDQSRDVDRFRLGQNVAVTWSLNREPPSRERPEFSKQIQAWFEEVQSFSQAHIRPFVFKKMLGHYTQLAWAETFLVGCGYAYFREAQRGFTKMYVCNYGPTGNVVGGVMYRSRNSLLAPICAEEEGFFAAAETDHPGLCRTTKNDVLLQHQTCIDSPENDVVVQPVTREPVPPSAGKEHEGQAQ